MTHRIQSITMGNSMDALLPAHDAAAYARVYTAQLGWPIGPGHRFRPRAGCTCEAPTCPTPGAHPLDHWSTTAYADQLPADFDRPGVAIIAPAIGFDAVTLPRAVGMMAMVAIERRMEAPCLVGPDTMTLLVQPGTAAVLGAVPTVTVRSGADHWIALPPSHDTRWDTPPWAERTGGPRLLPHGLSLVQDVRDAQRLGGAR
ncbi:hypothetical protein AAHZ94_26340 [Streptomyces sp. HSW2009]|uniref:hypothetical protein n=1 Tax=Streptomyces sp. HSW2009 TaxID=3142890 RepID=UPI0032EF1163